MDELWLLTLSARKGGGTYAVSAVTDMASEEEAVAEAWRVAIAQWPPREGYCDYKVSASTVPRNLVRRIANQEGY